MRVMRKWDVDGSPDPDRLALGEVGNSHRWLWQCHILAWQELASISSLAVRTELVWGGVHSLMPQHTLFAFNNHRKLVSIWYDVPYTASVVSEGAYTMLACMNMLCGICDQQFILRCAMARLPEDPYLMTVLANLLIEVKHEGQMARTQLHLAAKANPSLIDRYFIFVSQQVIKKISNESERVMTQP